MKKSIRIENVDCANCAAKIERNIQKLDGVKSASYSFMTQKLNYECDDDKVTEVAEGIKKTAKKVEPDCKIIGL